MPWSNHICRSLQFVRSIASRKLRTRKAFSIPKERSMRALIFEDEEVLVRIRPSIVLEEVDADEEECLVLDEAAAAEDELWTTFTEELLLCVRILCGDFISGCLNLLFNGLGGSCPSSYSTTVSGTTNLPFAPRLARRVVVCFLWRTSSDCSLLITKLLQLWPNLSQISWRVLSKSESRNLVLFAVDILCGNRGR